MTVEKTPGSAIPILFDNPLSSKITPQLLRQNFDGTVFNGEMGVRVEFYSGGDWCMVRSFKLSTFLEDTLFLRKQDGWEGAGGYYTNDSDLGKRLNDIVGETKKEWEQWKRTRPEHGDHDFRSWKKSYVKALGSEYQPLVAELDPLDSQLKDITSKLE